MLWLTPEQMNMIVEHVQREAPHEACGIIAGHGMWVERIIPTENIADNPHHRFYINPSDLSRGLSQIEKSKLDLIGFYHSHPNGEPIPSQTDIKEAVYPDTVQLIVGLKNHTPKIAVWHLHHGRVNRVEHYVGDMAPQPLPDKQSLTTAQRTAIILSATIATALMLILSLSLLPPAPPQ